MEQLGFRPIVNRMGDTGKANSVQTGACERASRSEAGWVEGLVLGWMDGGETARDPRLRAVWTYVTQGQRHKVSDRKR